MTAFHGIQVYEILNNGNLLNGIYTNTGLLFKNGDYNIDSEFAIRIRDDKNGIGGVYQCKFMETDMEIDEVSATPCELKIDERNNVYTFTWSKDNKTIYKGIGLMTGITHISVSYVKA